jgi:hypothetical protein
VVNEGDRKSRAIEIANVSREKQVGSGQQIMQIRLETDSLLIGAVNPQYQHNVSTISLTNTEVRKMANFGRV